jgi:hypothetical protein
LLKKKKKKNSSRIHRQVHIHDKTDGYTFLGKIGAGTEQLVLPENKQKYLDETDIVVIRIYNEDFLADGDLAKTGVYRTHLFHINLLHHSSPG